MTADPRPVEARDHVGSEDLRPDVTVQTVLYGNDIEEFRRNLETMARSIQVAQGKGLMGRCALHIGDSSPRPVIDDAVLADFQELFEPLWGNVTYDHFNANLGSAAGHNRLLGKLNSRYVLIANPDVVYAPTTLTALVRRAEDSPHAAVIEARQIPIEHPKAYDLDTGVTAWATTACALIRGDVAEQLEGFDAATFFLYCDDVDFCWRARLAGHSILFEPAAVVFHDKRLDAAGRMVVSAAEHYFAAEAALLLPHKYSRADVVKEIRSRLLTSAHADHQKAVAEYDQRATEGRLPDPIDQEGRVAEFVGDFYTRHRF